MRVDFYHDALVELETGALYYESRRPGLGVRFLEAVESAAGRIAESPNS